MLRHLSLALCAAGLAACGVTSQRPEPPLFANDAAFSADYAGFAIDTALPATWWRAAVPDSLLPHIEQALASSPELRRARADVAAAQAALQRTRAAQGLAVNAGADARLQKASGDRRSHSRSATVDAELPLDLRGDLAADERAATLELRAVDADAAARESDLVRDLLLALTDGAEAQLRADLLQRQTALAARLLDLIELRFTQGLANSVDVLQQRDQLAALRQQRPVIALDLRRASNRARRLAGSPPAPIPAADLDSLPDISGRFARTTPMALLQRRPALRAGQARLAAADARFAAALAKRWPRLGLSADGLARAAAGDLSTLISATISATLTLFDSGERQADADQRRAQLVAAGEQLLGDWIDAVVATDDLIHLETSLRERLDLSEQRLDTASALLRAAQRRYERGVSDYLPVLEALRSLQQQQRDHLALQAELTRARIQLHHAIGQPPAGGQA